MQVVTVENFGRNSPDSEEPSGNLYGGHAWLFRFVIESVEQFFGDQIPYLVDVFEIDQRQIYRLVLCGSPGGGLYDVRLFISFTKLPTDGQIARLQVSAPQKESSDENDHFPDLLMKH